MMNMDFVRKLPIPKEIKEQFPIPEEVKKVKAQRDAEITDVFTGKSDKFLLIIGPCSADREDSVLDYVCRLAKVQEKVKDKIIIIPRIYTNKPRTTGQGYKGMVHQPDPTKAEDMLEGLISIRKLHTKALTETGLACADEMLYPENSRYLSDILSYIAIGARSVENQQHRLTASGMMVPVGMKNPTSGDYSVMLIPSLQHSLSTPSFTEAGKHTARAILLLMRFSEVMLISTAHLTPTITMRILYVFTICIPQRIWRIWLLSLTLTTLTPTSSILSR